MPIKVMVIIHMVTDAPFTANKAENKSAKINNILVTFAAECTPMLINANIPPEKQLKAYRNCHILPVIPPSTDRMVIIIKRA